MQFIRIPTLITTLTLAITATLGTFAQSTPKTQTVSQAYKEPHGHTELKDLLIAEQENINNQFNLQVANFINFDNEEEPEEDIYELGWESGAVNCYAGVAVPQTAVIDVKDYAMPVPGYMTSPYGYRKKFRRMHKGVDLKLCTGDTVYAAFSGKVRIVSYERKGYGKYIVLRHGNDLETVYGHLSKFLVEPNEMVKVGQPIALGGNTGRSTGPHLHFETRYMGYAINPSAIFDFANQCTHTDTYTFDKNTYQKARNFSPDANAQYAKQYTEKQQAKAKNTPASSAKKPSKAKTYKVVKGDTLGKIASRHGITLSKLCQINGIKSSSTLRIGQVLKVQ